MEGGLLSLKWNDHSHTFFDMLSTIRKRESYCDVTLVCEGRFYPVHKLVLSTCSEFFDKLFNKTDCKHPVVIVANVASKDLEALLNYMYLGEMNVLQTELGNLMKAAEVLRIKGLAEPTDPSSKESKAKDTRQPSPSESSDSNLKRKRLEETSGRSPKRFQDQKPTVIEPTKPSVSSSKDSDPLIIEQTPPSISSESAVPKDQSASVRGASSVELDPLSISPREEGSSEKSSRTEIKTEEISIKDEAGLWFEENEGSKDNEPFSEQDATFTYDQQTVDFASSMSWPLSSGSQPPAVEGHFSQGLPGASGLQGPGSSSNTAAGLSRLPKNFQEQLQPFIKSLRIPDHPLRLSRELDHSMECLLKRKRCRVCYMNGVRRDTSYQCVTCCIPLCQRCNPIYHNNHQYWKKS